MSSRPFAERALRAAAAAAAVVLFARSPAGAQPDPRAAVVELEWLNPGGYERCAGVVTARRPAGAIAWTAAHCAAAPFSIVRFFDGPAVRGSAVRVLARSDIADAAALLIPLSPGAAQHVAVAVVGRTAPPLGAVLTVVGHPVSALLGPDQGRWTVTYARMGETVPNQQSGAPEYEIYCTRCGPGDSGSGVFDAGGGLVGIVYGVTDIANAAGGRLPDGRYALVVPAAGLR
jgi:hypothetical protein